MIMKILAWELLTLCAVGIVGLGARQRMLQWCAAVAVVLGLLICLTLAIGVALL